jgi:hypothetical protein
MPLQHLTDKQATMTASIVLDQSGERAYAMWEQSVFSVQMAGQNVERIRRGRTRSLPSQFLVPKVCSSEIGWKFVQLACTVPTQQKFATLSAIKTIRYRSFITRSG